ncbi:MAG: hypothetical protein EXS05_10995 [Planctomycetaceae bacterium]|nr:hypothetical protein [Planctomycetaceae bacterium]
MPVRLSAGTALPQSLPEGTAMTFSVDYQVTEPLNPSSRYVLIVERAGGMTVELSAKIDGIGTQLWLVPNWNPEDAPFQVWIEEIPPTGSRRQVSKSEPLL